MQIEVGTIEIHDVTIVGVSHLGTHKICLRCSARVEPSSSSTLRRCTKSECAMLQRYDICPDQLSAKMLFMADSKLHSITAYGKNVKDLARATEPEEVTEESLMEMPGVESITFNEKNIMTKFNFK